MNRTLIYAASAAILVSGSLICRSQSKAAKVEPAPRSTVILFENDIHCNIDAYAVLAGYRDAVADTAMTAVVSCGDFLQGGTPGALSKGQYCIDVMKKVGYDAVTLGNHEFDYKVPRMLELLSQLGDSIVVDANFVDVNTRESIYKPYRIKDFDGRKIAFLGLTTPTALNDEAYAFFDGSANQKYDLMDLDFFGLVQRQVDAARAEGADKVIVVSHLGEEPTAMNVDSHILIANTTGIDALVDGHTHNVVGPMSLPNKEGKPVLTGQTGTRLGNIGKILIRPDGNMSMEFIPTEGMNLKSSVVQCTVDSVKTEMDAIVNRVVCHSDFGVWVSDGKGDDIGRRRECTAGDMVCDAFRIKTGSDIGISNAGGIRNDLPEGDITYGDIVNMLPYDNNLSVIEVPGSMILNMLKENTQLIPDKDGQFPQVSGLKFTAVVADHSIRDVQVLNKETGEYEPLDPEKKYTIGTTDYCIYNGGLRKTLEKSVMLKDAVLNYRDAVTDYLINDLGGKMSPEYAAPQGRITIVE